MNYGRRLSTRDCDAGLACLCSGLEQNLSISNEIQGTSAAVFGLVDPLSSGAIPQWPPADRQTHTQTTYRELEPHPLGAGMDGKSPLDFPLCATFPTGRGDKFTDAGLPPQLPLLRDSKSFVKRISPVAGGARIRPQLTTESGHAAVHRLPTEWTTVTPSTSANCTGARAIAGTRALGVVRGER
jgi:hypothetical protein